jgi:hypothetical protein
MSAAAANAAAFRDVLRRRRGSSRPGSASADRGFAKVQRDCFIGASLTVAPAYTWRVA